MWAETSVFYQIYPLGFCGAEAANDGGEIRRRFRMIEEHIPSMRALGVTAVYLCPLFESETHGYDITDYSRADRRLGDNADLKRLIGALHAAGIRVVFDGVFNHVGRGFFAFADVRARREQSPYCGWFHLDFGGNNEFNDGLWYEGWEGHNQMVKLNQSNGEVRAYFENVVRGWISEFDIDGLRLDVCYSLEENFLRGVCGAARAAKPDFWIAGEIIHGDYNRIMGEGKCDSATNYECYKGLYSALNSRNLFEFAHSLARQFGPEQWTLYKGRHTFNFADNHDVTRAYTVLTDKRNILPMYTLLFAMPGIPCVYYGSEWGCEGDKRAGDSALRPSISAVDRTDSAGIFDHIAALARVKTASRALNYGGYKMTVLTNTEYAFERSEGGETVFAAVNISDEQKTLRLSCGAGVNLLTGEPLDLAAVTLPPHGSLLCRPA